MCEKEYKRYIVMGLRNGHLHHIIARRGHTPDDIVNRALEITGGSPSTASVEEIYSQAPQNPRQRYTRVTRKFDRLYVMEVGDEGTYGNSTNLKLQEIVEPPPRRAWTLVQAKGIYG
ncbi:hypothetical protein LCGC14_1832000 [marine sediment metagenome]|uniref:Uncharacterized protein n=1 Tax=marine sediment metagenome TaxID=412755 RepID=A0A0F9JFA5_9ZZZZ